MHAVTSDGHLFYSIRLFVSLFEVAVFVEEACYFACLLKGHFYCHSRLYYLAAAFAQFIPGRSSLQGLG